MRTEDFLLSEELLEWRKQVRHFVNHEITLNYIRACDINREYPYDAYEKVARQGWLGILVPEEYGGMGADLLPYLVMLQELGTYSVDFGLTFALPMFTVLNIVHHGTEEQKKTYLRPFIDGEVRFSISMTEPEAGSDVGNISTHAVLDGDEFVINGTKIYSSAAHVRDNVICVLLRTDLKATRHDGMSMILVPSTTEGVTINRLPTLARHGTGTNQVFFEDVRVPRENLLGEMGMGWNQIMEHLALERLSASAIYARNAQQAVDDALAYARERVQFGRPIAEFQVIKHTLAQMQVDADAAQLMVIRAAQMVLKGEPAGRELSEAKLFASETLLKVATDGMQILGGASQLPDMDMERYWREGKQATIGGGTSQIQRSIIAKTMGI